MSTDNLPVSELPGVPQVTSADPLSGPLENSALPTNTGAGTPTASATPAPAQQERPWAQILKGALWGLSGVHKEGRGGFATGVAQGAQGFLAGEAREQTLKFESVRAADAHLQAMDAHRRADQLDDAGKQDYKQRSAMYQAFLQDNFGIAPDLSFNDTHTDAIAGLSTAAAANGGTIPPVAALMHPEPDGTHGQISVYTPSQQVFTQNMKGYRDLIDTQRAAQGLPKIDDATFNSMGFKGARDAATSAIEFLKPTPAFSLDKNRPDFVGIVLAQRQQQLQQYQNHKDNLGQPDANPKVVNQLQNGIDYLQNAQKSATQSETDQAYKNKAAGQQAEIDNPTPLQTQQLANEKLTQKKLETDIAEKSTKPIYAFNNKTNQLEQTTRSDMTANPGTFSNPVDVKEADLRKDQDLSRQLGDAQMNMSRYRAASQAMPANDASDRSRIAALIGDDKLKAELFGAALPTDWLNKLYSSAQWGHLSPEAQHAVIGYIGARGSVIAFQKAISGSGRSNKEQLELELQNIPSPLLPAGIREDQFDRFQQNIDQAGAGLPKMVGIDRPQEIRARIETDESRRRQQTTPVTTPTQRPPTNGTLNVTIP